MIQKRKGVKWEMKPGLAKRTLLYCGKVLLASVGAFVVLTLFYAFYENSPYSLICEDGVTNEKYRPYVPYCRMTEGLSYGRTNNDGYIDLRDYEEGMPIDVLVMGSSQMEALEVPQQYCTANSTLCFRKMLYTILESAVTFCRSVPPI